METLTSLRNPALLEIRKAIARGSLTERGFCVAEGFHLLEEALRSGCPIDAVFATKVAAERLRGNLNARIAILPDEVFRSIVATETSQGIVTLVKPPAWTMEDLFRGQPLVLILDGVQDPGNAGAMLRAAEAFGASGVAMLKGSVNPYNPKALRAAAGSTFRVPLLAAANEVEVLDAVKRHGAALFALMPSEGRASEARPLPAAPNQEPPPGPFGALSSEAHGPLPAAPPQEPPQGLFHALSSEAHGLLPATPPQEPPPASPFGAFTLDECSLDQPCAIVVGGEGRGVGEMWRNRANHLRIPTIGVESLNAAMAATVVLYEARKQRMALSR